MTSSDLYQYAGILIFVPWGLLVFAPKWRHTEAIAFGAALILLLAAAWYTFEFLSSGGPTGGHVLSLDGLLRLFREPDMLLTGWFNYLSFCLLVGIWQVHDARQEKIPHLLVVPSLALTMVAGPVGLLLYLLFRFFKTRRWDIR